MLVFRDVSTTRRREEDGARFDEKNQASYLAFVKLLRSTYIFHLSKEALTLLLDTKMDTEMDLTILEFIASYKNR